MAHGCEGGLRATVQIGEVGVFKDTPRREFLHVNDVADACLFLMQRYGGDGRINVGTDLDLSIQELAEMVHGVVYLEVQFVFDATKPDGTPRKLLDVSRLHTLGWRHHLGLQAGIEATYRWFVASHDHLRESHARATRSETR